ncbi:MAG: hypothetical protein VYB06_00360, partial [Cyanobacteriota bacterium]|nr:hypothetical protein [Cyanobacteriota bacterium]
MAKNIPRQLLAAWNGALASLMVFTNDNSSSGDLRAGLRAQRLLGVLARLVFNVPARKLGAEVKFEGLQSQNKALSARLDYLRSGNIARLFQICAAHSRSLSDAVGHDDVDSEMVRQMAPDALADRFCALASIGEYSRAIRLLGSTGIAPINESTMGALRSLIKETPIDERERLLKAAQPFHVGRSPIPLTASILRKALRRLPRLAAAALSGWRNDYLRSLADLPKSALRSLLPFFNSFLLHEFAEFDQIARMVRLVPFIKVPSGIRPVGVPDPFHKLKGQLWLVLLRSSIKRVVSPFQFGVLMKAGIEALSRSLLDENAQFPMLIKKKDAKNFF